MPTSNKRKNSKLHCQHCSKPRLMNRFFAINTEQQDKEKNVYPFKLRKFLELIQGEAMVKLPKFYAAVCPVCFKTTYYKGRNHGTTLEVIPT